MAIFSSFCLIFIVFVVIGLVVGLGTKKILAGSFGLTFVAVLSVMMMATTVGDSNVLETDCVVFSYSLDSVSSDLKVGYLPDGTTMSLPLPGEVNLSDSCMLVIVGKCLYRKTGWWTPFDMARSGKVIRKGMSSVLYLKDATR